MELWQVSHLDQFNKATSCFKVINSVLTGNDINKQEVLLLLKSKLANMY